jgi:hypothetical protein
MRQTHWVIMMGIFSFLFGSCSKSQQPRQAEAPPAAEQTADDVPLPEITSYREDESADVAGILVFAILNHVLKEDGAQAIGVMATYQGNDVALYVILSPDWDKGMLDPSLPLVTYTGQVVFEAIDERSNAFIQALDELYGTGLHPKVMRDATVVNAVALRGEPADLAKGLTRIKLFFGSEDEEGYAELYTVIDLEKKRLYLSEKDPDYRAAIVRALAGE